MDQGALPFGALRAEAQVKPRARLSTPAPHVCRCCRLPLVQPQRVVAEQSNWRVYLRCPSCRWTAEELLDDEALRLFDEELERGTQELIAAMHEVTESNMREYVSRFVAALRADAIVPGDF
jgi:hypothetical protein